MKFQNLAAGIIVPFMLLNSGIVSATDQVPVNAPKMSQIVQKLQQDGFTVIKTIEFDGKQYKVKVINSNGSDAKLTISLNGDILNQDDKDNRVSLLQALQSVESSGYKSISDIKVSSDTYKIKAFDQNNKEVTLDVDAKTGKISN